MNWISNWISVKCSVKDEMGICAYFAKDHLEDSFKYQAQSLSLSLTQSLSSTSNKRKSSDLLPCESIENFKELIRYEAHLIFLSFKNLIKFEFSVNFKCLKNKNCKNKFHRRNFYANNCYLLVSTLKVTCHTQRQRYIYQWKPWFHFTFWKCEISHDFIENSWK